MTIQKIIEDFEKALWDGKNPDILEFVHRSPQDKQPALLLLLEELKTFYDEALEIEIPQNTLDRIYSDFQKETGLVYSKLKNERTLESFFELSKSIGKQLEDIEPIFSIPETKLKKLAGDTTALGKPGEFGRTKRLELGKKYSIDFSSINKLINRVFSAIQIIENEPLPVFTRSKKDDINHFQEIKEKLIEAIFEVDASL